MKNDRLFHLLYILLEKETITAPQLASLLEVSVRTVYRDVETLCMAGIPIQTSPGKGGGISLMPGYTFDKTVLSDQEQNQILFALQSLAAASQVNSGLLAKLGNSFQKENTNWIEVDFSRWGFQNADKKRFEQLKTAILEKRVISLTYCGTSGSITLRQVKAVRLIFKEKCWYLQGFCMQRQDFRLFKISRMLDVTLLEETFSDIFPSLPPLNASSPPFLETMKLCVSPSLAFRVYEEFSLEDIEPQEDGSFIVTVTFPMDNWVISYLLSFGTDLTILQPDYLNAVLHDHAKKIAEHYKS